jgi:hypothetical protein
MQMLTIRSHTFFSPAVNICHPAFQACFLRSENLHLNVSPLLAPPEAGVDAGVWASWLPGVVILTAPAGRQVVEGQGVQDMALEAARGQYTCSRVLSVRDPTCVSLDLCMRVQWLRFEAAVYAL